MAPGQVLFDQVGLGRGKVGGWGIEKSAAVQGLERGTSFGKLHAPYLKATAWRPDIICAPGLNMQCATVLTKNSPAHLKWGSPMK